MSSAPSQSEAEQLFETLRQTGDARLLAEPRPEAVASEVVERLKAEADRYWAIDPNHSLELASLIQTIGQTRGNQSQIALGQMAEGDALKFLGRYSEAWEKLAQAGQQFQAAGDEVGWARTRIGRLYLGVRLNRVAETLAEADQARRIFARSGERERGLRLEIQTALVHNFLGQSHQALACFDAAMATAAALGEAGQQYFGTLYTNIGFAYDALGDLHQAQAWYEKAATLFAERGESLSQATVDINLAYLDRAQGHYSQALRRLHDVLERSAERLPQTEAVAQCDLVECYLSLNRYVEARDLARQVIQAYRAAGDDYRRGQALLHLATAEATLGEAAAAALDLDEAGAIFASLGSDTWAAVATLRRGQLRLRQGNPAQARLAAESAAGAFAAAGQQASAAEAELLRGQAALALGDLGLAATAGAGTLGYARRFSVPALRYGAHLLLGRTAEEQGRPLAAGRHYQAAALTAERVQRGLTITLRPGFLEEKSEATRRLIALQLRAGQPAAALATLERAKSQVLLGYLLNHDRLLWVQTDEQTQKFRDELERLRAEHQWYSRLAQRAQTDAGHGAGLAPDQALAAVTARERAMRAITEQLYLRAAAGQAAQVGPTVCLADVQEQLGDGTVLVEYYTDGAGLWAFVADRAGVNAYALPDSLETVRRLLGQWQLNLAAALKLGPRSAGAAGLLATAQRILQRLHAALLATLPLQPAQIQRLIIVPYGALHYLPFHLLHDGRRYLIENFEVVIMPAAGLMTRPAPRRSPGALVLAHSRDGLLPHVQAEADLVHQLFGGTCLSEQAARRATLQAQPRQILHIAAHGQYRLDQPDLSYLELADGPLYADDLLQQDLSYELVTLSACETGRAAVAGGEELIGLGRGLLYAGAGALVLSLWSVPDESTVHLMASLYGHLRTGASKAAALRRAQRSLLSAAPNHHPAFWGAFQLTGDAGPLTAAAPT